MSEPPAAREVLAQLRLPEHVVEAIAERAAQIVLARLEAAQRSRWMTVAEAAAHARCTRQHI